MGVNLVQADNGSMGLQGKDLDAGPFIYAAGSYDAASVDRIAFIATRALRVTNIIWRVTVAGTDGSAVTAQLRKLPDATALTAGTVIHSGTANLKGTALTNQTLTLSTTAGALDLAAGDAIGVDFTGTLTSATGHFTVGFTAL